MPKPEQRPRRWWILTDSSEAIDAAHRNRASAAHDLTEARIIDCPGDAEIIQVSETRPTLEAFAEWFGRNNGHTAEYMDAKVKEYLDDK